MQGKLRGLDSSWKTKGSRLLHKHPREFVPCRGRGGHWGLPEICPHPIHVPGQEGSCQRCRTSRSLLSLYLTHYRQFSSLPPDTTAWQSEGWVTCMAQGHPSRQGVPWEGKGKGKGRRRREKRRHPGSPVSWFLVRASSLPLQWLRYRQLFAAFQYFHDIQGNVLV